jgi:hypothetical protein
MQTRLIHPVGVRIWLRRYWGGGDEPLPGCSNAGKWSDGRLSYHNAMLKVEDRQQPEGPGGYMKCGEEYLAGGKPPNDDPRWAMTCERCGQDAPDAATRQVFVKTLYDTPSGEAEPGSLYWAKWKHYKPDGTRAKNCWDWDNCDDPRGHLTCVLPNGHDWDIESRASNCTLTEERTHRCWVRRGDPDKGELVHIDKAGHSCAAGAGSILSGSYHGFLINGVLTSC